METQSQQSVAETQMSLEEIREKMPDVYAQIKERRANPQPSGMLGMIKHDYKQCCDAIIAMENEVETLRERARLLDELVRDIERTPDVLDFMKRFDALPVPGRR